MIRAKSGRGSTPGKGKKRRRHNGPAAIPGALQCGQKLTVTLTDLAADGRGIAHHQGKVLFVSGALPGETCRIRVTSVQSKFDEAVIEQVEVASAQRVQPFCANFERCGGCSLQHLPIEAQREHKLSQLEKQLRHAGVLSPKTPLTLHEAGHKGYRRRAKLACYSAKNKVPLVGFRQEGSQRIEPIDQCPVLEPELETVLPLLQPLINGLQTPSRVGHLDLCLGLRDSDKQGAFLGIHAPKGLLPADLATVANWAERHDVGTCIREGRWGETIIPVAFYNNGPSYPLSHYNLNVFFDAGDFFQVNTALNEVMVAQACEWMALKSTDRCLDLFCGIGNFSLPLALACDEVVGVEVASSMVQKASHNACINGLDRLSFIERDLLKPGNTNICSGFNKVLLDPPRSGAFEMVKQIAHCGETIERVVYVSCNPSTFIRDARVLLEAGMTPLSVAALDMFPQTAHMEVMALFTR